MKKHGESGAVMALASIMSIRMLGLFMILPVFSVYATKMPGASATLVGVALGIYGLTQALLQMPFGALSDRIGRKPIIATGLLLLLIGSIVAASSHTIYTLLIGRALQGAGAVGSTVLALLADLTRDESRSKAMAFMGLSIGFAFTIAMILGPVINSWFHLSGIFWATALLSCVGLLVLFTVVKNPPKPIGHQQDSTLGKRFRAAIKNPALVRLNIGIFSLHAILTAMFLAIPIILFHTIKLTEWEQVAMYLSVLIIAFIVAVPLIIIAEKKRKMKPVFVSAIAIILLVQLALSLATHHTWLTAALLLIFFTAFTLLEATLPSLVSKIAPIRHKGTAMGVYSSSQFFGIFVGGALGGLILAHFHTVGVFLFCAALALTWLFVALSMQTPPHLSTLVFSHKKGTSENDIDKLLQPIEGIAEIALVSEEGLLYLKVDKQKITENELQALLRAGNLTQE